MKNFKNLGLFAIALIEIVGMTLVLVQYKILSQNIVIWASAMAVFVLIIFSVATFFRTFIHNVGKEKQPARSHQIKFSVIIFWVSIISSLVMMIITNVLAFAGFSLKSGGVLSSMVIWCICVLIFGIMYLCGFINDDERQRK